MISEVDEKVRIVIGDPSTTTDIILCMYVYIM